MPRWSRSRASWAASSPLSSSADSSPSSPGGWPSARSSPASSASTSTSTWQRPDWGSWDLPGGTVSARLLAPHASRARGVFAFCHLAAASAGFPAYTCPRGRAPGTLLQPALGTRGFVQRCQRGHRLLPFLLPFTTVPVSVPAWDAACRGREVPPQRGLLLPNPSHCCWEEAQLLAGSALHGRDLGATSSLPSADFGVLLCVVCLSWLRASVFL